MRAGFSWSQWARPPVSRNSTTALTGRTASGAFESSGFTITVTSRSGQSTGVPTASPAPLVVTVTANNPNKLSAGGLVKFTLQAHRLVRIGQKREGWIFVTSLVAQPKPPNLTAPKAKIAATWPMTSLHDMVKEPDLQQNLQQNLWNLCESLRLL
jgi:hypothetical protein